MTLKPVLLHPPTGSFKEQSPQFALLLESPTTLGKCQSSDTNIRSRTQFCKRCVFLSCPMNQSYFIIALILLFGRNLTTVISRCPQFRASPILEVAHRLGRFMSGIIGSYLFRLAFAHLTGLHRLYYVIQSSGHSQV